MDSIIRYVRSLTFSSVRIDSTFHVEFIQGQTMGFQWTSPLSSEFAGFDTFQHWPIRSARWVGDFDDSHGILQIYQL